ncbi:MAG TPA: anthranilate synthase component I [Chloroflexota bacterium]|nr:anthranilate synthase component I [Chloroflexota bacterium]
MEESLYHTEGGVTVHRAIDRQPHQGAIEPLLDALDSRQGAVLTSSYEYPGRYTRWDMGFVDPPLRLTFRGLAFELAALNERGQVLLPGIREVLARLAAVRDLSLCHPERSEGPSRSRDGEGSSPTAQNDMFMVGRIEPGHERFFEEERSKQPSAFTVVRALVELFASETDPHLGLYGAFGYDLAFQFEPIRKRLPRPPEQRDLVLYLPDELLIVDHQRQVAERRRYDFELGGQSTIGLARGGPSSLYQPAEHGEPSVDHAPGEYAAGVALAKEAFRRGDLFEVVPGQTFSEPCRPSPAELFRRLRRRNPAPYGFLMNLGEAEYLVGASPEMYVRVEGRRVETCPISGTIARGADAIEDAENIRELLNSAKDESELTMCTDVDRNDKSRICEPGSVRVIGRRQIEMYSRLIHTVDHVEGELRPEFDALDAFLAHTWAVTVTGAPKAWAMQFLEDHEKSARCWYGGAVGVVGFNGNLNTGLTLRTIHVRDGVARVRVGATLLYDSDPEAEEAETRLKASAFLDVIRRPDATRDDARLHHARPGEGRRILLVDHQDSFVHTLANYLRQTGAEVVTLRAGEAVFAELASYRPDLVLLSPGPGRPSDFDLSGTIGAILERDVPLFGVCLGLQGIVEHFGGQLDLLPRPVHGKPSRIRVLGSPLFEGLPEELVAGRYHSLYARRETLPSELRETAVSDDGVIMAIEHVGRPIAAVQFHPESILTLGGEAGLRIIHNVVAQLANRRTGALSS